MLIFSDTPVYAATLTRLDISVRTGTVLISAESGYRRIRPVMILIIFMSILDSKVFVSIELSTHQKSRIVLISRSWRMRIVRVIRR
jgi:hypothetical protein